MQKSFFSCFFQHLDISRGSEYCKERLNSQLTCLKRTDIFLDTFLYYGIFIKEKMFGNIGFPEIFIILVIALLIFGPKKLPEVGKSLGKAFREFRRTSDEIKEKIEDEIQADEIKDIKEELEKDIEENEEGKKISR